MLRKIVQQILISSLKSEPAKVSYILERIMVYFLTIFIYRYTTDCFMPEQSSGGFGNNAHGSI